MTVIRSTVGVAPNFGGPGRSACAAQHWISLYVVKRQWHIERRCITLRAFLGAYEGQISEGSVQEATKGGNHVASRKSQFR